MELNPKRLGTYALHIALFVLTFFTTALAGIQWLNRDPFELANLPAGLPYAISLLAFLAAHEFGHYFTAVRYGVSTTLPFFIPIPPFLFNPFGTMGAVIRIRSPFPSRRALFDVGIAGPLAGFVVTLILLAIGLSTLPGKEYLYRIHPEYALTGSIPTTGLTFGNSILFWCMRKLAPAHRFMPPMNEIYHYPYLCVAWFGLFVTAMNLLPVGQLDGGHVLYSLVGPKMQGIVARVVVVVLLLIGLTGFLPLLGGSMQLGTFGWLIWAAILFFVVKLDHPPLFFTDELDPTRRLLGWAGLLLFFITFTPIPFYE